MHKIEGAKISIFYNTKPVRYCENDGYIGKASNFKVNTNLVLSFSLPPESTVYENQQKSQELKPVKSNEDAEGKFYIRQFSLLEDDNNHGYGWLYPRMRHNNSNRLKIVIKIEGGYRLYEIGFCNQNERLFFRIQLIREVVGEFVLNAPQKEPDTSPNRTLPKNIAKVLWYNDLSGVMAVRTNTGTARGHWSEIINCETRFIHANTTFIIFSQLSKPHTATRFEQEAVRGIALTENIPTVGETFLLVQKISSADELSDGFSHLKQEMGF